MGEIGTAEIEDDRFIASTLPRIPCRRDFWILAITSGSKPESVVDFRSLSILFLPLLSTDDVR